MNHQKIGTRVAISLAVAMALASCGGGSGGDGGLTNTPPPGQQITPSVELSGTAATGAPFAGAAISVLNKSGTVVGSGTSGADGSYTITLSAGATGPFVLQAVRDDLTLVSVAPDSSSGTVNITPITNLIASRLGTSGDPTKLAAEFQADPNLLTSITVTAKVDEIIAVLKPLLDAMGATANPLTGKFAADGTGSDRVLDSLSIKITPESATTTNIEVSVKQAQADDRAQPEPLQFSNASTTVTTLPAVTAASLVKPGTAPLIAALLTKMNSCFALAVADRVSTPDPTNIVPASGIKAPACKAMFYNDDPSTFLSNGRVVGSNGAFGNIFRTSGNNLVFDRGTYEFTRFNGDIVIGYRSTDSSGNVSTDTFAVRPDNAAAPTKLQQIGNQYLYDGGIKPYQQLRTFVNQPASDYYSTGYNLAVNDKVNIAGFSIFSKVEVTTPKGRTLTLKPKTGYTSLQLVKAAGTSGETNTGTSFLRLRSEYVSTAKAASQDPATADIHLFFAPEPSTDLAITGFAQHGVWKFDYYLADNTSSTPNKTQHYRTRARALSIGELKHRGLADLAQPDIDSLVSKSSGTGYFATPTTGPASITWVVPAGSLAPTSLSVWGRHNNVGFSDSSVVGSTVRTGTVSCVKKVVDDAHCTGSNYAAGTLHGLHLWARDLVGREFAHFYATYSIGAPE